MRLDEAEGDAKVGGDETFVHVRGRAGGGGAEVAMSRQVAGIVVDHAVVAGHGVADDLADLVGRGGAVKARRDEDRDFRAGNAGGFQTPQDGRQHQAIRRGAGDVADGDGGGAFALRQRLQRFGAEGRVERVFDRLLAVGEREGGFRLQHHVIETIGQFHRSALFSKSQSQRVRHFYRPLNEGGRFSRKCATPSLKSSHCRLASISCSERAKA